MIGLKNFKQPTDTATNLGLINAGDIGGLAKITGAAGVVLGIGTENGNF